MLPVQRRSRTAGSPGQEQSHRTAWVRRAFASGAGTMAWVLDAHPSSPEDPGIPNTKFSVTVCNKGRGLRNIGAEGSLHASIGVKLL